MTPKASTLARRAKNSFRNVLGSQAGHRTNAAMFNQALKELQERASLVDDANEGDVVVTLSPTAYAMVCGLVAPAEDSSLPVAAWRTQHPLAPPTGVWHQGIFGPIDEVQSKFPAEDFWAAVKDVDPGDENAPLSYDTEAGL